VSFEIRLRGADGVVQRISLGKSALEGPALTKMLDGIGFRADRSIQRGIREQKSPDGTPYKGVTRFGRPGKRLMDKGRLIGSISHVITGTRTVTSGTNLVQGPLQHFGGKVEADSGKMLAIPLTRQVARAMAGRGLRAAFPDAFVIRLGAGYGHERTFVVQRTEKGVKATGQAHRIRKGDAGDVRAAKGKNAVGRLDFLAMLVRSVSIEGTHFNDISPQGRGEIGDYILRTVKGSVEGSR
jgi:hypothetical protein